MDKVFVKVDYQVLAGGAIRPTRIHWYVSGHRSQNSLRAIARRLPDPRPGQHLRNIRRRVAALGEGLTQQPARPRVEVDAHARGKKTGAFAALGRMRGGLRHQRAEATGKDIP